MPANVNSMAYVGDVPWHGLGKRVEQIVRSKAMIEAAGLDWMVEKRPARGAQPIGRKHGEELYSRYEIIRMPRPNSEEPEVVLGIVTDRYEPLQNYEAFDFFDPIIDRKTAFFETAGALGDGERVWVMAKMPDAIEVVTGDECQKYLLLSNTHNGQGSVIVKFTAIRVVCQNTLMLSLQDGQPAFRVKHSRRMSYRLSEISELIAAANAVYQKAAELFQLLAKTSMGDGRLDRLLNAVYPKSKTQELGSTTPEKWTHIKRLLDERPDLQMVGVKGTLWAAYNAITAFEDYRHVNGELSATRLGRVWFGSGAEVKRKALEASAQLAQAN